MRKLTEEEIADLRARCAGLDRHAAIIAGGRWMAEHWVMHWTSDDVEGYLYGKSTKTTKTQRK